MASPSLKAETKAAPIEPGLYFAALSAKTD